MLLHQYAQCTQESPGIPAGNQGQIDAAMLQHGRVVRSDLAWDQQGDRVCGNVYILYVYICICLLSCKGCIWVKYVNMCDKHVYI